MSEIEIQNEEEFQSNIGLMLKEIIERENSIGSFSSSYDEGDETSTNFIDSNKNLSNVFDSPCSSRTSKKQLTFQNQESNIYPLFVNRRNKDEQKKLNTYIDNSSYKHFFNYFQQSKDTEANYNSPFEKTYPLTENHKSNSSNFVTSFIENSQTQGNETSQYYNKTYFTHLEFLLGKTKRIDRFVYSQISGNINTILSHSKGCKLLQNYLHGTNPEIINLIFQELKDSMIPLITSFSYSHYFLLKIYDLLPFPAKKTFLNIISHHFLLLSTHNISTYFIQNIIDKLTSSEEQIIIIKTITPIKFELSLDKYGTYVIEKIVSFFEYNLLDDLLQFIVNHFVFLACNSHGLCIIKTVIALENSFPERKYHNLIKQIMIANSLNLIQNPYGNYAIQIALDKWNDGAEITHCFNDNIVFLSLQKYSSNVIEKCFELNYEVLIRFIYYLYNYGQQNELLQLLNNTFGNFVLMKALKLCSGTKEFTILKEIIIVGLSTLNDKKLLHKWTKILSSYC